MPPTYGNTITGVILAGGKSSRMGSNKALLRIQDKTFIEQIAETLSRVVPEVIVIADERNELEFLDLPIYQDIYKECGPLGGLHSAFIHAKTDAILAVTCDMPLLEASLLFSLCTAPSDFDAALFSSGEFIQPFPGFYRRTCLTYLEGNLLKKKYSVISLIRTLNVITHRIPPPVTSQSLNPFTHINNPTDYRKIRKKYS